MSGAGQKFERFSSRLDSILDVSAEITLYAYGFKWAEGPVWLPEARALLFADVGHNCIRKVRRGETAEIFIQPSGYLGDSPYPGPEPGSSGMTLDARGRLTVAGHAGRTVWRLEGSDARAPITTLAESYAGEKLNSPNDLVYRSDGALFFSDPPYGLPTQHNDDPKKQLPVNGVYLLRAAAKQAGPAEPELLVTDLNRPNGLAFSPDERTLYISDSIARRWVAYTVTANGELFDERLIHEAKNDPLAGNPDGIKVDAQGNLYTAGPGGVWIFAPDFTFLGRVILPTIVSNLAWADDDAKTLVVTASDRLYSFRTKIPGIRPGSTPLPNA